ncbi:hypothetical protein F5884DRAFT_749287 [Xylogone sp. PMI_703]|nr:hypothetical protein F5884DRAFT_749287 [Xylogone sp. PMI_703]
MFTGDITSATYGVFFIVGWACCYGFVRPPFPTGLGAQQRAADEVQNNPEMLLLTDLVVPHNLPAAQNPPPAAAAARAANTAVLDAITVRWDGIEVIFNPRDSAERLEARVYRSKTGVRAHRVVDNEQPRRRRSRAPSPRV